MNKATKLLDSIESIPIDQTPRMHLGASEIGNECVRAIWYSFRWASYPKFSNRMLRLFNRGHREEIELVKLLEAVGCTVLTQDVNTGEQFTISDFDGYFGGSLDSVIYNVPDIGKVWVLGEFKTRSTKTFQALAKDGVKKTEPKHYVQMQIYMHYKQLQYAVYISVDKNTDELHIEIIEYDPSVIPEQKAKAEIAIYSKTPPAKISSNPSFYKCKFCNFHGVCQMGYDVEKNCRTCDHVLMIGNGQWKCSLTNEIKDKKGLLDGCSKHKLSRSFT